MSRSPIQKRVIYMLLWPLTWLLGIPLPDTRQIICQPQSRYTTTTPGSSSDQRSAVHAIPAVLQQVNMSEQPPSSMHQEEPYQPDKPTVEPTPVQELLEPASLQRDSALSGARQSPMSFIQRMGYELSILPHRLIARLLLIGVAFYIVGMLLWSGASALRPFLVGLLLAYLLLPIVNLLNRSLPRWFSILTVYVGGFVMLIVSVAFLVNPLIVELNQLLQLTEQTPSWDEIVSQANKFFADYNRMVPEEVREPIEQEIEREAENAINALQNNLAGYAENVVNFLIDSVLQVLNTVAALFGFVMIPFWLFFVLHDQRAGVEAFDRMLPTWMRDDFWAIVKIFDYVFSNYIRGQIILGFVIGIACWGGLSLLGLFGFEVRFILLLAVFAGIMEFIPVIGPVVGAVPAILIGLFDSPSTALAVLVLYLVIQQLEGNLLVPRIVGESVNIHPAILMVLLLVCGSLFGILGALLSAPVAAVARDVFVYGHGRLSNPPRPAGSLPDHYKQAVQEKRNRPVPVAHPQSTITPEQTE